MKTERYRAQDLIQFGRDVLVKAGFPEKQAQGAVKILVEADLRGDHAHGITGANSLGDFILKIHDDKVGWGFKRLEIAEFSKDQQRYPTILSVDANGTLGHYVALEIIPELIEAAKKFGYAKVYIRNSTHFGDCGIYSEIIAAHDLAAKVSCTSQAWTKPFIELEDKEHETSLVNKSRYRKVIKRFGTNPIAWSIPYEGGVITIDMAATQRAVSPTLDAAKFNSQALGIFRDDQGECYIETENGKKRLSDLHLSVARCETQEEVLGKLNLQRDARLIPVEKGLLKGPEGEDIRYPLAYDNVFKKHFWIAPLGGTFFGYKGFGLNMLIELDNVLGGGVPGLIRVLDDAGNPTTPERVSQTLEAYAIDGVFPLQEAKRKLKQSVETTMECGNELMHLPGQKEQERRKDYLENGIPVSSERIKWLKSVAADERIAIPFTLTPIPGQA